MKNFLGRGLAFPIAVGARGSVETAAAEQSISQSVKLILGTAIGERLMRPEFGCRIHDLVFHPVDPNTCSQVALYVEQSVVKWEPRVSGVEVDAYPDPTEENKILIAVNYEVRSTNNMHNLVYPFYLRREQDL